MGTDNFCDKFDVLSLLNFTILNLCTLWVQFWWQMSRVNKRSKSSTEHRLKSERLDRQKKLVHSKDENLKNERFCLNGKMNSNKKDVNLNKNIIRGVMKSHWIIPAKKKQKARGKPPQKWCPNGIFHTPNDVFGQQNEWGLFSTNSHQQNKQFFSFNDHKYEKMTGKSEQLAMYNCHVYEGTTVTQSCTIHLYLTGLKQSTWRCLKGTFVIWRRQKEIVQRIGRRPIIHNNLTFGGMITPLNQIASQSNSTRVPENLSKRDDFN